MALLYLALFCFLGPLAGADDTAPAAGAAIDVRFVPPGSSGTVSLGIYDASGKLVRVLCDEWTFDKFREDFNGLATAWDGRDGSGARVPAGNYSARGFVVGDTDVAGEAFYFNDWIESADSPRIVSVGAQQILPDGDILLAARLAGAAGALVRYSPESEARWRTVVTAPRPEPAKSVQLAVSDTTAFVLLDGELRAAKLDDGSEVKLPIASSGIRAIAARAGRLGVFGANGIEFYSLPDFKPLEKAPVPAVAPVSLALLDKGAVAADEDGHVWLWRSSWSRIEFPDDVRVRQVSSGKDGTFWASQEKTGGGASVAQFGISEGNLAEWSAGQDKVMSIAGVGDKDYFAATMASPQGQRTVGIRRKEGGGWGYVFDKKITANSGFGWSEGKLVPSSSELPGEIKVALSENPLDPSAPKSLTLRATADKSGTGLSTADGLPLLRVTEDSGIGRVMVVPGAGAGTARFFQGDGACVEEYAISKLGDIISFDAGPIQLDASGAAVPAPVFDPDESPAAK